jgi:hypothetical protein
MFTLKVKDKHYRIPDLDKLRQLFEAGKVNEATQIYERDAKQWVSVGEVLARVEEIASEDVIEDEGYNEASEYAQTVMGGGDSFATPKADPTPDPFSFSPVSSEEPQSDTNADAYDPTTQFGSIDIGKAENSEAEAENADSGPMTELESPKSFDYGTGESKPKAEKIEGTPVAPAALQAQMPISAPPLATPRVAKPKSKVAKKGALAYFFGFDVLISSALIKVIYALGFVLLFAAAIGLIVTAAMGMDITGQGIKPGHLIVIAILGLATSQLIWRVICEVWILAFSIHDHLVSVDSKLD